MATQQQKKTETEPETVEVVKAPEDQGDDRNSGTDAPESYATADTAVAENAGISEGEVKALRDDAGLNQMAGHDADIHAWSLTPAGKDFADGEKDRNKVEVAKAKEVAATFDKDGLTKAEAAYVEAADAK